MYIIDLSCKNSVIDMNAVLSRVDGIIIRIGYRGYGSSGSLVKDKMFDNYMKYIIPSGKPWGVYMIDQAINQQEGIEQADFIHNILKEYDQSNLKLGVWCDSESSNGGKGRGDIISKELRTNNILSMLDKLTKLRYKNGIYASNSWLNDKLIYDLIKDKYIWNASYGQNNGLMHGVPSRRHDLFQYTSKYSIDGVKNTVDMSILYNNDFLRNDNQEEQNVIKPIVKGSDIILKCQQWLNTFSCNNIKEDGFYGNETKTAITKSLQTILKEDYSSNYLVINGKFSTMTKIAIKCVKLGMYGRLVKLVECCLFIQGYNPQEFNGNCIESVSQSIYEYQEKNGLTKDKIWGKQCWTKYFG